MRTPWILSLALIGCACSSPAGQVDAPRDEKPAAVNGTVPVRVGTGDKEAADVVALAHARITRAYDVLAARGSCYMPVGGGGRLVFSDADRWVDPTKRPPLPEPGQRTDIDKAEWVRYETNQEDYDFLGVDVALSADGRSVVVTSKFGDVPGLTRVVAWIRERLKP